MSLSLRDVESVRALQDRVRARAQRMSLALTRAFNLDDAAASERKTAEALATVLETFQPVQEDAAMRLATASWSAAGLRGSPVRVNAPLVSADTIAGNAGWVSKPLYGVTDGAAYQQRLLSVSDRLVSQQFIDNTTAIGDNSIEKLYQQMLSQERASQSRRAAKPKVRTRYALVPAGKCCAYCVMRASRGAVFHSADIAKTHDFCRCSVVPIFQQTDGSGIEGVAIKGYDPKEYLDIYSAASSNVPMDTPNRYSALLAEIRRTENIA